MANNGVPVPIFQSTLSMRRATLSQAYAAK